MFIFYLFLIIFKITYLFIYVVVPANWKVYFMCWNVDYKCSKVTMKIGSYLQLKVAPNEVWTLMF